MHLVGFIVKKFVTMHGHMNVKFVMFYTSMHHIMRAHFIEFKFITSLY
jgi:hypothetical protein